ncbi:hypothetical protein [Mycobacteroides salmoniphilum]|uniref:hypothetical protein n=1 Tax=Mycobacteroides salmoniphilum TaxID=404941 RepID=UPI00106676B6|nr:hypothetical protein [Mycobacteroides salmoniphilum]
MAYDGLASVIRLELDASDARVRHRLQRQWEAVFRLHREAAARCRAYLGHPPPNTRRIAKAMRAR